MPLDVPLVPLMYEPCGADVVNGEADAAGVL